MCVCVCVCMVCTRTPAVTASRFFHVASDFGFISGTGARWLAFQSRNHQGKSGHSLMIWQRLLTTTQITAPSLLCCTLR